MNERDFRISPDGQRSEVWAIGRLIPEPGGTRIEGSASIPATTLILNLVFIAFFLALMASWLVGPIIEGLRLPTGLIPFVVAFVLFLAFGLRQMYAEAARNERFLIEFLRDRLGSGGTAVVVRHSVVESALEKTTRGPTRDVLKRLGQVVTLLFIVAFVGFFIHDFTVNEPIAQQMLPRVEAEFEQISPVPDATRVDYNTSIQPGSVLVDASYNTLEIYPQIQAFYDWELTSSGWHFQSERSTTDWGRDLGGKEVTYCKGSLRADLDYAGEKAHYGWTYAFSIVWGRNANPC